MFDAIYLHPIEGFVGMWILYTPLLLFQHSLRRYSFMSGALGLSSVPIGTVLAWELSILLMCVYHSGIDMQWPPVMAAAFSTGESQGKSAGAKTY